MDRRRYLLLSALGLGLLLSVAALVGPQWYWTWVGRRNHEQLYQGKPASYWSAVMARPSPSWASYAPMGVRRFLDMDGWPAVLRGDPDAVPVLVELLKDENSQVRSEALVALDKTPNLPASVVQPVMALLNDDTAENRSYAAGLLSRICSDETVVVPAVLPLLRDHTRQVRESAIWNLAKLGPRAKNALPDLTERLRDRREDIRVRCSVAYALGEIGQQMKPAVAVLRESLKDETLEVRVEAAKALWHMTRQAETVLPVLVAAAKEKQAQTPDGRVNRSWTVRAQAVSTLGELGPQASGVIPTLVEALDDPEVRWAACSALDRIGPEARVAVRALARVVREEKHDATLRAAIRALGHIGPDAASAVPSLTVRLETRDQTLRADIAGALGAIGPSAKQAVPSLLTVYERDEPPFYDHQALAAALRQIDTEAATQHGIP